MFTTFVYSWLCPHNLLKQQSLFCLLSFKKGHEYFFNFFLVVLDLCIPADISALYSIP